MEFKDKLKQLRKQENITQDALAFEIHVSRSTIAKWEAGLGLPQKDSIEELCKIFNVFEDELISSNYKEEALITKNLKIYNLNKRVVRLSIAFSIIIILSILITSLTVSNIKDVNKMGDIYTSIQLVNYTNNDSNYVATAGEIDRRETLLKYEYGYSYQHIQFEKIKYTDKSSLVLIKVSDQFVPGGVAYNLGDTNFKKNSPLDACYIEISFDDDVNIIYSWPNLKAEWIPINSIYSENIVYDFSMFFSGVQIEKVSNQFQFYYHDSFDDIVLSKDKKEIIRDFHYNSNDKSTVWSYQMYDGAKNYTLNAYSFYLIEVNDEDSNSFEFSIITGMNSGKHEIKRKQNISCYLS